MDINKIENILDRHLDAGDSTVHGTNHASKDIYKLHLEAQLELLHTINDEAYKYTTTHEEIISNYCEELETKLKELE